MQGETTGNPVVGLQQQELGTMYEKKDNGVNAKRLEDIRRPDCSKRTDGENIKRSKKTR
jgi:hypothetical protein